MSKLLVIDPGHGDFDPGGVGNGLKEKDVVLIIAKLIRDKLKVYDIKVLLTRTTDTYLTLTQRAEIANKAKADAFLSIHTNAGGGTGYEDFIYNGNVSNNTLLQHSAVHTGVIKQIGGTNRGKKRANFAVLRQTNMPAVLTENLFIDRKEDAEKLKDAKFLDKVAQGHVDGIVNYFGLKKKPAPKPAQTKSVYITTGGLTNENLVAVIDFMRSKNWWGQVTINWQEGSPKLRTGGLNPAMRKEFETWLKNKNWWYKAG